MVTAFYEEAEQIAPVVVFAAQVGQAATLTIVVLVAEEVAKITVVRCDGADGRVSGGTDGRVSGGGCW